MSMTLTVNVARKYLSDVFVETGTSDGGGVQVALNAGYKTIYSIESDPELYEKAQARFVGLKNVFLFLGNSASDFPKILNQINTSATFWLDAHPLTPGESPLFVEIYHIRNHPIKTHTIMIDDRRVLASNWNINEQQLIKELLRVNPSYQIEYAPNQFGPEDIIVAYPLLSESSDYKALPNQIMRNIYRNKV